MIGDSPAETTRVEVHQADSQPTLSNEGPKDNKNRIISRLKNISKIVGSVNQEQSKGAEQHPFNVRASELVKLGDGYTTYLETHADEITDEKTFQAIASLAKTSLLMNIEQYRTTIQKMSEYVKDHQELNNLNIPGDTSPWNNITEALYYSKHNDIREKFRESILLKAKDDIKSGEFDIRDVDHIERFLTDPKDGRTPKEFIPEYIGQYIKEIRQWSPLTIDMFQEHVVSQIENFQGDLSQNEYLKQLDEEIASIKQKNLQKVSLQFADRQEKLAFIRDLRFGRVNLDEVKSEVAKRMEEITRRTDLKTLAPHLKAFFPPFLSTLKSTVGANTGERKPILLALVESYGLAAEAKQAVLDYLETNLK